jgi:UDP-N-acetylmuramyl pentapeptide phosphotransferase/UDP-N-acetylglucosamine-1-phosphate transferase
MPEGGILLMGGMACLISYFLVALMCRWATQWKIIDIPNERSSHSRPTPRGGGLAILLVTLVGVWLSFLFRTNGPNQELAWYTLAAIVVAGISWVDDVRSLSVKTRFAAHGIAAFIALAGIGSWHIVPSLVEGSSDLLWLNAAMTWFWIVGLTNAYNFMDGIDGIAGGQAVVAGCGWAILGALTNQETLLILGVYMAFSSLGFLGHNWPPARIFMGDVGSAFLGFSFAVLPLLANPTDLAMLLAAILFLWPFLFDTTFTFFRRLLRGEPVFQAHRSHLYQRLVIAGCSHNTVTSLYLLLAATGTVLVIVFHPFQVKGIWVPLGTVTLLALALWLFVWRQEELAKKKIQG